MSGEPVTDLRRAARAVARRTLLLVPAFVLAACATPPTRVPGAMAPLLAETFEVSGRFSARRGGEGFAGQFVWSHGRQLDVLTLSAPTGQALARLTGDAERVRLEAPDGKTTEAADWEQLTNTALGVPIPVRELAYWMRGIPRPGTPHQQEQDADGRVSLLRQNGWEIVYGYAAGDSHPARVRLTYPEVDVRLALDDWR